MMKDSLAGTPSRSQQAEFEGAFKAFVRSADTGLDETLLRLWRRLGELQQPYAFDADADMAKFTFENGRGFHLCTSIRRFHRPKKTGKPQSVTVMLGGFKDTYEDPEHQLIPCDAAGKIDCCYFGMAEDEEDLAMFFIEQMFGRHASGKILNRHAKTLIASRRKKRGSSWNSR